jgi:hypothetical protein
VSVIKINPFLGQITFLQKNRNFSMFQNFANPYLQNYWTKTGSEGVPGLEIAYNFMEKY